MKLVDLTESLDVSNLKRVEIRSNQNRSNYKFPDKTAEHKLIGWFKNKHNASGWGIFTLSSYDKKWMRDAGINNFNGLYRTGEDLHNTTSIIKLNLKSGTYAFADNTHMEETDELKFEKMSPYTLLVIDDGMEKYFK